MRTYYSYFPVVLLLLFFAVPYFVFAQSVSGITTSLVVSAHTAIPSFYMGRTLPVNGSDITVTALVFENGVLSNKNYQYIWKVNGRQYDTALENSSFEFSSQFDTAVTLTVSIRDANQNIIDEQKLIMPMVTPEIYLYEVNPLRGIAHKTVGSVYNFIGNEVTIEAAPYYFDANSESLEYSWEIGNREVATANPLQLTLQKTDITGATQIGFTAYSVLQPLQSAKQTFMVQY